MLAAALLFLVVIAHAEGTVQQTVHRCIGRHGEIVFSGLTCTEADAATRPADARKPASTSESTRNADMSCPATRERLRERIATAVASHDSNMIASVMRWRGVAAGAAGRRLRELALLTRGPLLALDDATGSDGGNADLLRLRTGSNLAAGTREHAFGVAVEGGCYWLVW